MLVLWLPKRKQKKDQLERKQARRSKSKTGEIPSFFNKPSIF
jgi:hypothetical protein